ncbi:MAG: PAS domain S-box protein [Acidobacteria bacterium]|nr:PAS domain S-box protein [Acidobacteriota bacterium]
MAAAQSPGPRIAAPRLTVALALVAVCTATLVTLFELAKQFLFPHISIWHSHELTISFTTLLAVVAAFVLGSRLMHLNEVLQALVERRNDHIARLQETQAHNAAILRSSIDCIISMDEHGRITEFNPAAEKLFGHKRDNILGKMIAETIVPASLRAAHSQGLQRYLLTGESRLLGRRYETVGLRADGVEFPLELGIVRVELPGPPTFTAFLRDLSEQKRLEQQLIRAQKMESIGRLAGGIAHDFNNLLTIVMGYTSRLHEYAGTDEKIAHEINGIRRATDRAATLTRQLLAFSRQQVLQPVVLNVNQIVEDIRGMLTRIIPERVEIVAHVDPELGSVSADKGQLEQVIVNLAVNARDAMPNGGRLTLETANVYLDDIYSRAHVTVTPGEYVMLAVSDTGTGMDSATQEHIFEPFFTTKEVGKGTGLGLSSVYGIVKQSGGHIWVYSEPGQGTIFKIYLPRVNAPAQSVTKRWPLAGKQKGTETILLVEDNRELRQLVESALTAQGYRVLSGENPREAERLASGHSGDIALLLTDVVMPEMSGLELAERLQAARKQMKVIYMSGYSDSMVMRGNGDVKFLQKPFAPAVLTAKVREVLDGLDGRAEGKSA